MRSVYISNAYVTFAKTVNQREALAVKMRHSPEIAARAYYKIKTDDKTNNKNDNEVINELKNKIEALKIENNELKAKITDIEPHEGDRLYNKRKQDIILRLKKGLNVKPDMLIKYNLKPIIK